MRQERKPARRFEGVPDEQVHQAGFEHQPRLTRRLLDCPPQPVLVR